MNDTIFEGRYKNVYFKYTPQGLEEVNEANGILEIELKRGNGNTTKSTHIIENWGATRIFQYIESMENLV